MTGLDEKQTIQDLQSLLDTCQTDDSWRLDVLTTIVTELEARYNPNEIIEALEGVVEYKYVLDDADREYLSSIVKKLLKKKGE